MDVIALVGQSGTGKSHRALKVAYEHRADAIIDDGLLIYGTKVLAGYSAKNEPNKIQAVKRAIFSDNQHVAEVRDALDSNDIKRLLIIGTSVNMVDKIAARLKIERPSIYITIESIATKEEIKTARHARLKEGKHVIPLPTIELKQHFSGHFIDSLSIFFNRSNNRFGRRYGEKSIVRPNFSYYGKMLISNSALRNIVALLLDKNEKLKKVISIETKRWLENGSVDVKISINVVYGYSLPTLTVELQNIIKEQMEYFTGLYVHRVDVHIHKLIK